MAASGFLSNIAGGIQFRFRKLFFNPFASLGLSQWQVTKIKHQPPGNVREIRIFNRLLYYKAPQDLIHGLKEIFIGKIYDQQFPERPYIIDGGANIGLSSIFFLQQAPGAIIDAFEPDPDNVLLLKKNLQSFGYNQVTVHEKAIWKSGEPLVFEAAAGMSSKLAGEGSGGASAITVETVRLRDLLVKQVDFLKLDIEGAEYQVLCDIADQLHLVRSMFIEYHGSFGQNDELLEILQIVRQAGFQFYIKEAAENYVSPLNLQEPGAGEWDVQLNIFCRRPASYPA